MKKGNRPTDGGGNWMDTYGDMVTLLLTFFVMLYAMSSIDQQKWQIFVRSIYPSSSETQQEVAMNAPAGDLPMEGSEPMEVEASDALNMDELYLTLAQKMNDIGIDGVTLSRGEDYTFIVFEDKTFFDGESSVITEQGKTVLGVFCDAIAPARDYLSQINIMGHTSQGNPDRPNNVRTDRMLSAMRGAEVCIFIQQRDIIEPEKLVSIAYGQFRPIDTFETKEGRARNRRVEILMIDKDADVRSLNEYYEEYKNGANAETTIVTDGVPTITSQGFESVSPSSEGVSSLVSPIPDNSGDGPAEPDLSAPSAENGAE